MACSTKVKESKYLWWKLYKTYDNEEIEPFLFYKSFSIGNKKVKYRCFRKEFILYILSYMKITDKQNRKYYFVNDLLN